MEIFVGNLPFGLTRDELAAFFGKIGEIEKIRMMFDAEGRFRGMAYVSFTDPACAKEAVNTLNGEELGGRPMRVDFSRPSRPRFNGFGAGFSAEKPRRKFFRRDANGESPRREGNFDESARPYRKFSDSTRGEKNFDDSRERPSRNFSNSPREERNFAGDSRPQRKFSDAPRGDFRDGGFRKKSFGENKPPYKPHFGAKFRRNRDENDFGEPRPHHHAKSPYRRDNTPPDLDF